MTIFGKDVCRVLGMGGLYTVQKPALLNLHGDEIGS